MQDVYNRPRRLKAYRSMNPATFTTTLYLSAGTSREHQVLVEATLSLYAGRYRVDKLQPLNGATIMDDELEDAYDQVIDRARSFGLAMVDPAKSELRDG